jgi:hypothetical protein
MAQAILEASGGDRKVPSVTNVMAIVMAGMTKVFVGEITAEGERVRTPMNQRTRRTTNHSVDGEWSSAPHHGEERRDRPHPPAPPARSPPPVLPPPPARARPQPAPPLSLSGMTEASSSH